MTTSGLEPAEVSLLERTRSAVMNVLVGVGLAIAASGIVLGRREHGALLIPPPESERYAFGALMAISILSVLARRLIGNRSALKAPATRARRFLLAHVLGALIGAGAIPLGFAYGWLVRPRLGGVGPFWAIGLALGALAYPRGYELDGFDEPLPCSAAEPLARTD